MLEDTFLGSVETAFPVEFLCHYPSPLSLMALYKTFGEHLATRLSEELFSV